MDFRGTMNLSNPTKRASRSSSFIKSKELCLPRNGTLSSTLWRENCRRRFASSAAKSSDIITLKFSLYFFAVFQGSRRSKKHLKYSIRFSARRTRSRRWRNRSAQAVAVVRIDCFLLQFWINWTRLLTYLSGLNLRLRLDQYRRLCLIRSLMVK